MALPPTTAPARDRLLVVEDDPTQRLGLQQLLNKEILPILLMLMPLLLIF
jgi:CheY-like chemotaxis protein